MKILFLINSLQRNGAERIALALLAYLSENITQDTYILYTLEDTDNPLSVPPGIEHFHGYKDVTSNSFKFFVLPLHALRLRKLIKKKKIDSAISFLGRANYVNLLTRMMRSKHHCIISERNIPSLIYNTNNIPDVLNRFLKRWLYPYSDTIIAISQGVKKDLINNFGISEKKISVIYNPLNIDEIEKKSLAPVDNKWLKAKDKKIIITVGRLEKPKNQQMLMHAFKKVIKSLPQSRLIIIGEGSLRVPLLDLAKNLGINSGIDLVGYQNNPYAYLSKADLFVLSSSSEGFGNVIPEAMACGCPVISTDCPSGPGEIITNGKDGILIAVDDVEKMSKSYYFSPR